MRRVVVNNELVVTDYAEADYIVEHYSDYYQAYIRYLQQAMDGTDTVTIIDLAGKCPAVDGAVVYKARSLYGLLSAQYIVYDDDSCKYDPSGNFYRVTPGITGDENGSQLYSLYPNPNDGTFSIRQQVVQDKTVNMKVYDVLGRQLMSSPVTFVNGKVNLKLPQAFPGQYMIYIEDEGTNTRIKFTVK